MWWWRELDKNRASHCSKISPSGSSSQTVVVRREEGVIEHRTMKSAFQVVDNATTIAVAASAIISLGRNCVPNAAEFEATVAGNDDESDRGEFFHIHSTHFWMILR